MKRYHEEVEKLETAESKEAVAARAEQEFERYVCACI
jgi:hypothetical protein